MSATKPHSALMTRSIDRTQPKLRLRGLRGFVLRFKSLFVRKRSRNFFTPPPAHDVLPPAMRLLQNLLRPRINMPQLLRDLHDCPLAAEKTAPGRAEAMQAQHINLAVGMAQLNTATLYRLWRKLGTRRLAELRTALVEGKPEKAASRSAAKTRLINTQFAAMAEMLAQIEEGARQTLLARGYDFSPIPAPSPASTYGSKQVQAYANIVAPALRVHSGFLPAPARARLLQSAKNAALLAASKTARQKSLANLAENLAANAFEFDLEQHACRFPLSSNLKAQELEASLMRFCRNHETLSGLLTAMASIPLISALTDNLALCGAGRLLAANRLAAKAITFDAPPSKLRFVAFFDGGSAMRLHLHADYWIEENLAGEKFDKAKSFLRLEARFSLGAHKNPSVKLLAASYASQLLQRAALDSYSDSPPLDWTPPAPAHGALVSAAGAGNQWMRPV